MELNDVMRALRTKWRLIIAGLLVGLAIALVITATAERKYSSTTQFFVSVTASASESRDPNSDQQFSQQRVISYVQLLTGRELAQEVITELGLDVTPAELSEMITATPLPDTVVLEVEVTADTAERAQLIATSVVRQFTERVRELETPEGAASSLVTVRNTEPPSLNPDPVSPATTRIIALGAALGLLVGIGLALLRARTDRSILSEEQVAVTSGAKLLGRVAADRQLARRRTSSSTGAVDSAAAEAFRTIRVNLQHVAGKTPPRAVVVAGSQPGDGATTVALNLALSLAGTGHRVLLVDADLRRPRVARQLSLPSGPGLTDVLAGDVGLQEVARRWGHTTLAVLDAGALPTDPTQVLDSPAMRSLLTRATKEYDHVIIDAPPLGPVVDGAVLSALTDGCLLVTRFGRTTADQLAESLSAITQVQATVLGLVLNGVPRKGTPRRLRGKGYAADSDRRRPRRTDTPPDAPGPGTAGPSNGSRPDQALVQPTVQTQKVTRPVPPAAPRGGVSAKAES